MVFSFTYIVFLEDNYYCVCTIDKCFFLSIVRNVNFFFFCLKIPRGKLFLVKFTAKWTPWYPLRPDG